MKTIKILLAFMLLSIIVISCKSDKKNDNESKDDVVEVKEESATEKEKEKDSEAEVETEKITVVYPKDEELAGEVKSTLHSLIKEYPDLKKQFQSAYGFALFPKITKAGLGIGGAGGKGLLFEHKKVVGSTKIAQATFGLQAGGQQYSEVIFFENKSAIDKFKSGKLKFAGQVSAVALKEGTSLDIDYQDGVSIITKAGGGVMAEAAVGGQKFTYEDGV